MVRAYARAAVGERVASATTLILPRDAAAPVTCWAQRFSNNSVSLDAVALNDEGRPRRPPLQHRPPGLFPTACIGAVRPGRHRTAVPYRPGSGAIGLHGGV